MFVTRKCLVRKTRDLSMSKFTESSDLFERIDLDHGQDGGKHIEDEFRNLQDRFKNPKKGEIV